MNSSPTDYGQKKLKKCITITEAATKTKPTATAAITKLKGR